MENEKENVEVKEEVVEDVENLKLSVNALIEAGVHFGHRASHWNPKMRPYVYGRRKLIHIIDVRETVRGILRAKKYLKQVAAQGSVILFVGTKKPASDSVEKQASRCSMPYVAQRWLGGTLTNFSTIRSRLGRLLELEEIIGSEKINTYSKKMQSSLTREYKKMFRNLNGIREMCKENRYPEVMVVVDPKKEKNAVHEAQKLGVVTIALIDTDSNPDEVDLPIPGNDDSISSIDLVLKHLANAVVEGRKELESNKFRSVSSSEEKGADAE
ncbi:MAG: 30S ribosomal protein S2 [Planctomycetia bacterium]|nr:30S ribosomal protein S2 [Planctomycetia bacterium]